MLEYRNYKSLMINKKYTLIILNEIKITINEQLQNNVEEEIIKLYI